MNRPVGYGLAAIATGATVYYLFPLLVAAASLGEMCPYSPAGTSICAESSGAVDEPEPAIVPTTPRERASAPLCQEHGLRYRGETAEGADVCFTLTAKRDAWLEIGFLFVVASRCPEGATGRSYLGGPEPLAAPGRLIAEGFSGTIRGKRAAGFLSDATICAGKSFTWSARLVP